jgi:hypothetical protein
MQRPRQKKSAGRAVLTTHQLPLGEIPLFAAVRLVAAGRTVVASLEPGEVAPALADAAVLAAARVPRAGARPEYIVASLKTLSARLRDAAPANGCRTGEWPVQRAALAAGQLP